MPQMAVGEGLNGPRDRSPGYPIPFTHNSHGFNFSGGPTPPCQLPRLHSHPRAPYVISNYEIMLWLVLESVVCKLRRDLTMHS